MPLYRRLFLAAALLLLGVAARSVPAAAAGLAFVLNSGDASMSVLDVAQGTELRRVPLLREPHHMALTPDHKSLLVGDTSGNTLFFIDPATGAVQRQMPMSDPYQLQFSPNAKFLVVNGLARNQVDIYDAGTFALLHRIPIRSMPSHLNFSPDSRTVYVSLQQTNALAAIDLASGKVLWDRKVGETPAGVLWHSGKLLVANMGGDGLAVVDPADGRVLRRVLTGRGAHNLFIPADGKVIYVCNRVDGSIAVLDPKTLIMERRFRVPGGPDDMDFAPDGKIWATLRFAHRVAIIDPASGKYTTIAVGRSPHGIWLNTHDPLPGLLAANTHH
jgi:DNA-binding beta-propeller fold protein YncE